MLLKQYLKLLDNRQHKITHRVQRELLPLLGAKAVEHYKHNFQTESFDGHKWKDVKRRNPNSRWYGFEYKGDRRTYLAVSYKGGRAVRNKKQRKLNFSQAATRRKVLTGHTGQLGSSINYRVTGTTVRVYSPMKYAQVHNEGGRIKVFGKAERVLPKRQFIGKSVVLEQQKIKPIVKNFLLRALKM